VTPEAEWNRLEPILRALREAFPATPLSLDTRHAPTAEQGLNEGVAVLNDVTGFSDPALLDLVRNSACGLIAMRSTLRDGHLVMPPYPGPMHGDPEAELRAVRDRLLAAHIAPSRLLLDPGFGFGTTFEGDRALWASLPLLPALLDWPVDRFCLGLSRKRFLAWRAGNPELGPMDRDALTAEAHLEALALGYRVLRTHSV
jgi:dihydropteroate synthase